MEQDGTGSGLLQKVAGFQQSGASLGIEEGARPGEESFDNYLTELSRGHLPDTLLRPQVTDRRVRAEGVIFQGFLS